MKLVLLGACAVTAIIAFAACNEPSGGNTCASIGGVPIDARDNQTFDPPSRQVQLQQSFCFQNLGTLTHTITSDSAADSIDVTLPPNYTISFSYNRQRDFNYHCRFHAGMVGVIQVR